MPPILIKLIFTLNKEIKINIETINLRMWKFFMYANHVHINNKTKINIFLFSIILFLKCEITDPTINSSIISTLKKSVPNTMYGRINIKLK